MQGNILEVCGLTKKYPGVIALNEININFRKGEVHAIVGENGAGKSTLIKIVTGAVQPSAGIIRIDGKEYSKLEPMLSRDLGIGVIYQEFSQVPSLSVAENIFLGEKMSRKKLVDYKEMQRRAKEILNMVGADINPSRVVRDIPVGQQQIVEIAKAIVRKIKILIMDEPSAPLAEAEIKRMFEVIRSFKERGITVIYISHRLEEIFEISDRVSVLRDGQYIGTLNTGETTKHQLISMMVGREMKEEFPQRQNNYGNVILRAENISGNGVKDISFEVKEGEILGFAGLLGCGRTETMQVLFGAKHMIKGQVYINGMEVKIKDTAAAMEFGLGMVPEDRKRHGLFMGKSIKWNVTISCVKRISKFGVMNTANEKDITSHLGEKMSIKTPTYNQLVEYLSGGNQQKVIIARLLASDSRILILDEPTRGIDVGAKQEIYKLMRKLTAEGKSIIMISSELEEIIGMSDRIVVLSEGYMVGTLERADFSQEKILHLASARLS